ncbi:DUF2695 domain-containing protein [Specibacter cremeus]|uniref:DUF2695 domain-containing protein n=1 Tax=Specibacter cremeus TaxID=1629051 RepID=UPI000F7AA694|nr:DUF2695 domain-containing protein [Specibacter cremeus]
MEEMSAIDVDRSVNELAREMMTPEPNECLPCFVQRMVMLEGCENDLGWTGFYLARYSSSFTGLERLLDTIGGDCDCEVVEDVYARREELWNADRCPGCGVPLESPGCRGVGGSPLQPCGLWLAGISREP